MTAVEMLSDDVYIGGEGDCNVFTLHRNSGTTKESHAIALICDRRRNAGEISRGYYFVTL